MKLIRGGEVLEDAGAPAFAAKCAHCGESLEGSRFTEDLASNEVRKICRTKGWPEPSRDELVLCRDCYPKHQEQVRGQIDAENKRAENAWSSFKQQWPYANADGRQRLELGFRRAFPWLGGRLSEFLLRQKQASTPKGRDADSAAGFDR